MENFINVLIVAFCFTSFSFCGCLAALWSFNKNLVDKKARKAIDELRDMVVTHVIKDMNESMNKIIKQINEKNTKTEAKRKMCVKSHKEKNRKRA